MDIADRSQNMGVRNVVIWYMRETDVGRLLSAMKPFQGKYLLVVVVKQRGKKTWCGIARKILDLEVQETKCSARKDPFAALKTAPPSVEEGVKVNSRIRKHPESRDVPGAATD